MPIGVRSLYWSDVDPGRHGLDVGEVRAIAERHVLWAVHGDIERNTPVLGRKREEVETAIDRELIAAFGAWAAGWRWAASEPGDGGPVRSWCCASDSVLREGDASARETVERVVAAVSEWRAFLLELAERFAAAGGAHDAQSVERVASQLLPLVLERTSAEDAWYATFSQVLSWYLEAAGVEPDAVRGAVDAVISGRFESWSEPEPPVAATVCTELGRTVEEAARRLEPVDALTFWLEHRELVPGSNRRVPVHADGHRRFIERHERARDPERAARMLRALDVCRASAERGEALTFERLAAWQALVLDQPLVAFRTRDAFAKGGRERYGLAADTRQRFDAALAEANDTSVDPVARAARVYLDVCFFHPFADGNARAARLALDHVLSRSGLALHAAEPIFVIARSASDAYGLHAFAFVVDYLTGYSGDAQQR